MTKRNTCLNCQHLQRTTTAGTSIYGCAKRNGAVVPQDTNSETVRFRRVPLECPRPLSEVNPRPAERPIMRGPWAKELPHAEVVATDLEVKF